MTIPRFNQALTPVCDVSFSPSAYSATKATSTSADSEALATGVRRVLAQNLGTTATDYITLAFGATTAEAETNVATGGPVVRANSDIIIQVPDGAKAIAWVAAANTPSMQLTQGI